ncbi:hypothetical protein B0E33_09440 [Roseibium algicola]|jgi:hypothetical protein|uniref:Solute-binding protein family 3/N-terminal domain-containing protein n=1 Tax=Roseibium algicola TaxID=2857014 RepID=A0ABN4WX41_9HYPH|nr:MULTISPECIES: transporter substrate-binding domain-containing protein [Stappiaceae]AQQ03788.1 hypothetical protein B0E33_09440 [Roseibium aggregatum]MBN8183189.1 transporter substrate-binding domain-containing protein [Roseibium aggregatum]UES46744.1 transporter substrate-binding domain-containing protein [Roseibium aggregatum]
MRGLSAFLVAMSVFLLPGVSIADTIKVPTIEVPPWGKNSNPPSGLLVDVAAMIADEMGATPEFIVMPYKRVHTVASGCFKGFVVMPDHPEIRASSEEAARLWDMEVVLYSNKLDPVGSLKELEGNSVGLLLGSELLPEINANEKIAKVEVEHPDQMVDMLSRQSVSAIVGLRPNCNLLQSQDAENCVDLDKTFHATPVRKVSVFAWTPKCDVGRAVRTRIKEAVSRLQTEGALSKVQRLN